MPKRKPSNEEYVPIPSECWEYELEGGFKAYAGKTDADNDQLSLRFASANDYWFHVSGMPGSHVILIVGDLEPSRDIIRQAAAIAAYHSKARDAGNVAVNMTLAKYVTKPRGAEPGTVQIRRESTVKVKPGRP
jgi:predicted ribosome quality control (RQC) complex YloA/Tae2 family protein